MDTEHMDTEQLARQISLLRRLVEEANHRLQQVTADIRLLRGGIDQAARAWEDQPISEPTKTRAERTPRHAAAQAQEVSR